MVALQSPKGERKIDGRKRKLGIYSLPPPPPLGFGSVLYQRGEGNLELAGGVHKIVP